MLHLWKIGDLVPHSESLIGHKSEVSSVAFSPDGKVLASGSKDGTVRFWNVQRRVPFQKSIMVPEERRVLPSVWSIAFSPDGKILAYGSGEGTIRLWDIEGWVLRGKPLIGHRDAVSSVAFSPDGKVLASGSFDYTVQRWDVQSQKPHR
jgi:predicted NACHT family NTPase